MSTTKPKRSYNSTKKCGSLMRARLKAGLSRREVCELTGAIYDRVIRVEQRVRNNESAGQPKKFQFTHHNMVTMGKIQEAIDIRTGRATEIEREAHARIEQIRKQAANQPEPQPYGSDDNSLLTRYLQLTPEGTVITVTIPGRKGSIEFTVK